MADFVGGHNDAAETAGILNDGHTVDLLQSFVNHTGAAHIRKSCTRMRLRPGWYKHELEHVQQRGLAEEIL